MAPVVGFFVIGLIVLAVLTQGLFGWVGTDEQQAYDMGYGHYEDAEKFGNSLSCASLTAGHNAAVQAQNNGAKPEVVAEMLRQQYDSVMKKVGGIDERNGYDGFFISGYWDAANENCPQAFYFSTFAGRPGG
jgi:hypothetical protein